MSAGGCPSTCRRIFVELLSLAQNGCGVTPDGRRLGHRDPARQVTLDNQEGQSKAVDFVSESDPAIQTSATNSITETSVVKISSLPARDIACAFNYSCCCLHRRADLVMYFKHVLGGLSKRGGIFIMDLYGGTSSECALKLQRRFPDFTYIWEQQEFDVINRTTRISLHFQLGKKKTLRHAFSYNWRLWSLPEVEDCLREAGFSSVHFWMREMPDSHLAADSEDLFDAKYEEVSSFQQRDSWNAYVVGVAPCR